MSVTTGTTLRQDITAALALSQARTTAAQSGLPAIDWTQVASLLDTYRHEKSGYAARKQDGLGGSLASGDMIELIREGISLDRARLDPAADVPTLPLHKQLSDMLDQAIVEAVRADKKLLRGIYREMLRDEDLPLRWLVDPVINGALNVAFLRGPERLIETLVRMEATHQVEQRAELCSRILTRMLERVNNQRDSDSAPASDRGNLK